MFLINFFLKINRCSFLKKIVKTLYIIDVNFFKTHSISYIKKLPLFHTMINKICLLFSNYLMLFVFIIFFYCFSFSSIREARFSKLHFYSLRYAILVNNVVKISLNIVRGLGIKFVLKGKYSIKACKCIVLKWAVMIMKGNVFDSARTKIRYELKNG